jgi:hypothetical protein
MLDKRNNPTRTPEQAAEHLARLREFAAMPSVPFSLPTLQQQRNELRDLIVHLENGTMPTSTQEEFIELLRSTVTSISISLKSFVEISLTPSSGDSMILASHLAALLLQSMKSISAPTSDTRGAVPINLFFAKVHHSGTLNAFRECLEHLNKIVDGRAEPSAATSSQEL